MNLVRRIAAAVIDLRDACRVTGGAPTSLLIGILAAGLASLFAAGTMATSRPFALLASLTLWGLTAAAVIACLLARRGRVRPGLFLLAAALVGAGLLLGILFRWPLAAPYGIVLAFALVLPALSPRERWAAILLAVPLATVAVFLSSPDANWAAATMAGPLGQLAAGLVIALILLTLARSREAVEVERSRYRALVEGAPVGIIRVDPEGRIRHANQAAARFFGAEEPTSLEGASIVERFVDPDASRRLKADLLAAGMVTGEVELRRLDGTPFWARHRTRLVDVDGAGVGFEGTFEDVTAERAAVRAAAHLAAIVESADDAIVGLDPGGRITSLNPAATELFGFSAEMAMGRNVCHVLSAPEGEEEVPLVGPLARALSGQPVRALERRIQGPDGPRTVSLTISPIFGRDRQVVGASLVARDVTDLRRLERELGRVVAERAVVLEALRRIQASPSLAATADAIARALSTTDGFASAAILVFDADGQVTQVSSWLAGERQRPERSPLPERTGELRTRAAAGLWVEATETSLGGSYRIALAERGIRHLVYAPLVVGGQPVGLLALGTGDEDRAITLERLPAAAEFAAVASALLGPGLDQRHQVDGMRARMRALIDRRGFSTVFQPIVDLASGVVIGYEALTRFTDGTSPDRVFAEAVRSGLGRELEVVTLEAALEAAAPLPANVFLDLNVSPDLVLAKEPLATILARAGWGAVLEITEHAPIADYEAFRAAVEALGLGVRLAIDDAGAGYASLRHIHELRPAFVKLDRWLVAGIEADRSRQALVAGMVHAAERSGYRLVAEGVEREEERQALLVLGVGLGQGFLFGRPTPAETLVRRTPERLRPVLASLAAGRSVGRAPAGPPTRVAPSGQGSSGQGFSGRSSVPPGGVPSARWPAPDKRRGRGKRPVPEPAQTVLIAGEGLLEEDGND